MCSKNFTVFDSPLIKKFIQFYSKLQQELDRLLKTQSTTHSEEELQHPVL